MVQITVVGKFMTPVILSLGVTTFASPAGIITGGFLDEMQSVKVKKCHKCPLCGNEVDVSHYLVE